MITAESLPEVLDSPTVAQFLGVDEKTARKYWLEMGGRKIGGRTYRMLKVNLLAYMGGGDAISTQAGRGVDRTSAQQGGQVHLSTIPIQDGCSRLGDDSTKQKRRSSTNGLW